MDRVVTFILMGVLGTVLTAQQQAAAFEVASVKPSAPNTNFLSIAYGPGGTVRLDNVPLRDIIAAAYDLPDSNHPLQRFKLVGGPNAILRRQFDINARTAANADIRRKKEMVRTLLAERFKLRIRSEVREIPLYALTLARKELGPKMKRSAMNCVTIRAAQMQENKVPPGRSQCWADRSEYVGGVRPFRSAGPISHLIERMQANLDRPLVDRTGLTGNFEWSTTFRGERSDADAPVFLDAIRQDFGLRIDPQTGPYEVFVIESVEMPTPD